MTETRWVGGGRPVTLDAAAVLVTVETLIEVVVVVWRTELGVGLRGMLVLCLGFKLLLVALARRCSAGAVLGLILFEVTAVVAALASPHSPLLARLALGANGIAVVALLSASAHAFPSPVR